jgi:16S rRNA (guanine(966)-N(2))-methyltransferase RsmD
MRIISGKNKGRKIQAPGNLPVRPTTDMAKESLFNIISNHFELEEVAALDLFTGTGNISYELVSRGCSRVTAVDNDARCIKFVKQVINKLDYHEIIPIQSDYSTYLKRCNNKWDLIFADPPYHMEGLEQVPELIWEYDLLKPGGWLVIEHDKHHDFPDQQGFFDHRKYGKVNFSFFRK